MKTEARSRDKADCAPPIDQTHGALAPLKLDPERYRSHLESFEMTNAEQDELLQTLWNILSTFVDIGFGLDSVQNLFSGIIEKAMHDEQVPLQRANHFNHVAEPVSENKERNC